VYLGNIKFVFLGYEFQAQAAENKKTLKIFTDYLPAISTKAENGTTKKFRELNV
jgi:hypothetical protein